jgi:hypothetical protein
MPDGVNWPIEHIPDDADVFMRAHSMFFNRRRVLQPGVFRPHYGSMSVDWDKYSSPEDTRQRAANPQKNAVIALPVDGIRHIGNLEVEHTPDLSPESMNRAHSDVVGLPEGEDLTEVRTLLLAASNIVIGLQS